MNIKILSLTTVVVGAFALTACDQNKSATADLDRILGVASDSMVSFESKNSSNLESLNKGNVMDKFSSSYASDLNASVPPVHSGPIGVKSEQDGSFAGFDDKNNNGVKDADEKDLFKLEVDTENNRLVASNEGGEVRESGFSGTGLIMGMLLGNMLSRQRATGTNPAAKRATPKAASRPKPSNNVKSRVGSGSHRSGK